MTLAAKNLLKGSAEEPQLGFRFRTRFLLFRHRKNSEISLCFNPKLGIVHSLFLDPSSVPPNTFACATSGMWESSSKFQSLRLCAVLSARRVPHIVSLQPRTSLEPIGSCHVVHSQASQTLLTTSSTILRDDGCKSDTSCPLAYMSNPQSHAFRVNDDLRHAERRREFGVNELCRLAAQSVGRSSEDIESFVKLAEGGFNRTFLVTMQGGFKMVARIPYPVTVPKFYAVANEVATMRYLRSFGLPVPEVYGYSPSSDNAAKTEYIFMEFVRGTVLSDVWLELEEADIASVLRQLTQLESQIMSIAFPAGGSLYYTDDLEKVARRKAIPLKDEHFCVGPDSRLHMWYGRRSQLDVNRGPCTPLSAFC